MNTKELEKKFIELFGYKHDSIYFAPGRVNLIGEHIDYNGGYVFPCAIDRGTLLLLKKRDDDKIRLYSTNMKDVIEESSVYNLERDLSDSWIKFPKGIAKFLIDRTGKALSGFDLLFSGNIPNGSGLSSSASIEIVTAFALNDVFKLNLSRLDLVKLSQAVENEYVGVNSGIMDQFAVCICIKDNAVLLDCNTLAYENVPCQLKDEVIVIANTNKKRQLADSKYNERRAECEKALEYLQKELDISNLCELSVCDFEKNSHLIEDDICQKRAKHAVYENERTKLAKKALVKDDIATFGRLMNDSHNSLRDDYEVTCKELDAMVDISREQDGVIGSRMTGAGFGGCTVSIVKKEKVDNFIENVSKGYKKATGLDGEFYVVNVSDGAKKI